MDLLILISTAFLGLFIIIILIILKKIYSKDGKSSTEENIVATGQPQRRRPGLPVGIVARRAVGRRQRPIVHAQEVDDDFDGDNSAEDMDDEEDDLTALKESGKIGAKKLKKLEEKAERKAQREAMEQDRLDRKQREEEREADRKRLEHKQQKLDEEKAIQEEKRTQEEKEREEEEYRKMKAAFTVDEEGIDAVEPEELQNLLQEFVDHLEKSKVIMLEDLASKFNIKTQEAIDRVRSLQEEGRITGVMDDRGKFIYITVQEYEAVAKFIKQRGRVSITDLSENINKLIDLGPVLETITV